MTSSADYLALGLKDGYLNFQYNLGSGEVIIVYNITKLDDGKWHSVRATRYDKMLYCYFTAYNTDSTVIFRFNFSGWNKKDPLLLMVV